MNADQVATDILAGAKLYEHIRPAGDDFGLLIGGEVRDGIFDRLCLVVILNIVHTAPPFPDQTMLLKCRYQPLLSHRELVHRDTGSIQDGIADRRGNGDDRRLSQRLVAIGTHRVVHLQEDDLQIRDIERRRDLEVQQVVVQRPAFFVVQKLLAQGVADAHRHAAMHLGLGQLRIEQGAGVMNIHKMIDLHGSHLHVHRNIRKCTSGCVRVFLTVIRDLGCDVFRAVERVECILCEIFHRKQHLAGLCEDLSGIPQDRLPPGREVIDVPMLHIRIKPVLIPVILIHGAVRDVSIAISSGKIGLDRCSLLRNALTDVVVVDHQFLDRASQHVGGIVQDPVSQLEAAFLDGFAGDKGLSGSVGAGVKRRQVCILCRDDVDLVRCDAGGLRGHLGEDGIGSLPDLGCRQLDLD